MASAWLADRPAFTGLVSPPPTAKSSSRSPRSPGGGRVEKLAVPEPSELDAALEKRLERAVGDHPAAVEDDDRVGSLSAALSGATPPNS